MKTKPSAINLKMVEEILVILISELFDKLGLISLIMFLVRRLAWAIAIIAAGTRPPTNIPSSAIPENHPGMVKSIKDGTTSMPRVLSGNPDRKFMASGTP